MFSMKTMNNNEILKYGCTGSATIFTRGEMPLTGLTSRCFTSLKDSWLDPIIINNKSKMNSFYENEGFFKTILTKTTNFKILKSNFFFCNIQNYEQKNHYILLLN
jgi:hypothetical protein